MGHIEQVYILELHSQIHIIDIASAPFFRKHATINENTTIKDIIFEYENAYA